MHCKTVQMLSAKKTKEAPGLFPSVDLLGPTPRGFQGHLERQRLWAGGRLVCARSTASGRQLKSRSP